MRFAYEDKPEEWQNLLMSRETLISMIETWHASLTCLQKQNQEAVGLFTMLMKRYLEDCYKSCIINRDEYTSIINSYTNLR